MYEKRVNYRHVYGVKPGFGVFLQIMGIFLFGAGSFLLTPHSITGYSFFVGYDGVFHSRFLIGWVALLCSLFVFKRF